MEASRESAAEPLLRARAEAFAEERRGSRLPGTKASRPARILYATTTAAVLATQVISVLAVAVPLWDMCLRPPGSRGRKKGKRALSVGGRGGAGKPSGGRKPGAGFRGREPGSAAVSRRDPEFAEMHGLLRSKDFRKPGAGADPETYGGLPSGGPDTPSGNPSDAGKRERRSQDP
jgi:hypothetical protein